MLVVETPSEPCRVEARREAGGWVLVITGESGEVSEIYLSEAMVLAIGHMIGEWHDKKRVQDC